MKRILSCFGVLMICISGCQVNPTTGDSNVHIVTDQQATQQATLAYSSILTPYSNAGQLDNNREDTERVQRVFNKLLPYAQNISQDAKNWNWEVHVATNNSINAFCMAGGKIAVFTGLFSRAHVTDDELAFVLGHEMGHALAGHSSAKQSMQILTNIGLLTYNIQHKNDQQLQQKVHDLSVLLIALPYSRSEESQADKIGLDLMTRAGFQPEASTTMLKKLTPEGQSQVPEFLSTHPSDANRISSLNGLMGTVKYSDPNQETLSLVAPEFNKFKAGETILDCTLSCGFGNGSNRKSVKELYSSERWKDLAIVISKVNYEKDLNYFYLGKSAEGLGYKEAAKIYYKKAIELSTTKKRCGYTFKYQCNDIDVPAEATAGLDRLN